MAGPIISGAGNKAIAKVAQEVAKQTTQKVGTSKFDNVMAQVASKHNQVAMNQVHQAVINNKVGKIDGKKLIYQIFTGINHGQNQVDKVINLALSGKTFSPQELLVMQATVYKFTQELELTSKVIEQVTSGIKTTMNTQV